MLTDMICYKALVSFPDPPHASFPTERVWRVWERKPHCTQSTIRLSTKSPAVAEVQPGSTHAHYCAVGRMSRIVYVIVYCVAGYLASRRKAEQLLQVKLLHEDKPTVMLPYKSECSHHNKGGVLGCAAMTAVPVSQDGWTPPPPPPPPEMDPGVHSS